MLMALSPAALAWKLSTHTTPAPLTAHRTRRARGVDGDGSRSVIPMNQRHGLAVALQKVAVIDVDQGKLAGVVLHLQGDRSDIGSMEQDDRHLEGGAHGHRSGRRIQDKSYRMSRQPGRAELDWAEPDWLGVG